MSTIFETFENFSKTFKNLFKRRFNREEYFDAVDKIISFLEEGVESQNRKQDRKRIYYVKFNGMMKVYGKFMRVSKKREFFYDNYFFFENDASTRPPLGFWLELLKDFYFIDVSEIKKNHLVKDWKWKDDGTQRILQVYHNRNKQHLLAEFPTVDGVPGIFKFEGFWPGAFGNDFVHRILQVDVSEIEKNLFVEVLGAEDAKRILEFDTSSIKIKHFNNKKV
jgi:hypothetical protein